MEIKHYLIILRRWAWLLVLGLILGTISGYVISQYQTPIYSSSTKMLVVRASQSQNSDLAILSSQELGQTFIQLMKTSQILDPASEKLGYGVSGGQISANLIPGTQLISLKVEDTSPERAAAIANTLVSVLIEQNDNLQSSRYKENEESLIAQVDQVQDQITGLQVEIDNMTTANVQEQIIEVEAKISGLESEIAQIEYRINFIQNQSVNFNVIPPDLTARLSQLTSTLELYQNIYSNLIILGKPTETGTSDRLTYLQQTHDLYQQIYIQLLGDLEEVRLAHLQNTPNIVQIEAAVVPNSPVRPIPIQYTMLGGTLGLLLAFGIAFVVEYMDDTLRSAVDVEQILGIPVLGYIADMKNTDANRKVYVTAYPRSPVAEAFRTMRSTIEFSMEQPPKTILVTSSRISEGKTTIASNLAAIFAQSGKRVILVDADLRRPSVHSTYNIPNRLGLTTLLRSSLEPEKVWKEYGIGNQKMHIITSGYLPPNPAELLGSDQMLKVMAELRKRADIIIFDSPPILVADSQILASLMDGVILVLRPGKSPKDEAKSTLTQLTRSGAIVLGVTFNRLPKSGRQGYGYGYGYGPYGYYSADTESYYSKSNGRSQTYQI